MMKKMFKYIIFISFAFFSLGVNVYTLELQKHYVPQEKFMLNDTDIYILLDNNWLMTKALRSDEQGFYITQEDIIECGSRPSPDKKWQCPYCYRWWNYGEKCQNEDCPTNQW